MSAPAKERQDARWHGTAGGYTNHGCRCDACREAAKEKWMQWAHRTGYHKPLAEYKARVRAEAEARDNHGTETRYQLGCRCDECRAGSAAARRKRRKPIENPTRHGLDWVYRAGCRCEPCRVAWKLRQRKLRASRASAPRSGANQKGSR